MGRRNSDQRFLHRFCLLLIPSRNCMNGIGGILSNHGNAPNGQPYLLQDVNVNGNTITQATGMAAGIVEGTGFDNSVYTIWNNQFAPNTFQLTNPTEEYFFWMGQPTTLSGWIATVPAL